MKIKISEKEYKLMITLGLILVFLGIFNEVYFNFKTLFSIISLNVGIIMIIIAILNKNKYGSGIRADERDLKISSRAISHSWFYTFILINILFWINYFLPNKLNVSQTIGIILFFMIISNVLIKEYFRKKGDIE